MKIKIRISRKVVIILSAATVLFGASGAAALYLGRDAILGPSRESIYGLECQDVVRIADVRGRDIPWLRKYIRVASSKPETRLKTALRVAKHMEETLPAELIHVAVLDDNGPTVRAQMRGRAFGAEVFIFPDPEKIPGETQEYQGYYYEGVPGSDGIFYGDKRTVSAHELEELLASMTDAEYMEDCTPPETAEGVAGETAGHGSGGASEAPAGHGEAAAPAEGGHGAAPEGEGEAAAGGHEAPAEPGLFGKVLSFVGLGSSDAPAEGHGAATEGGHEGAATDGHGNPVGEETNNGAHDAPAEGHQAAPDSSAHAGSHGATAESSPSFFGKMKNMVGLGSDGADTATESPAAHGAEAGQAAGHEENADHATEKPHGAQGGEADGHEENADHAAENPHATPEGEPTSHETAAEPTGHGEPAAHDEHAVENSGSEAETASGHAAAVEADASTPAHGGSDVHEEAAADHNAVAVEDEGAPAEDSMPDVSAETAHAAAGADEGAVENAWEGSANGDVTIVDGPTDALMLGWQDDTLDAPADNAPASATNSQHGLVKGVIDEQQLDPAPVSSVKGNDDAAFH